MTALRMVLVMTSCIAIAGLRVSAAEPSAQEMAAGRKKLAELQSKLESAPAENREFVQALGNEPGLFRSFCSFLADKNDPERLLVLLRACGKRGWWRTVHELSFGLRNAGERARTEDVVELLARAEYHMGMKSSAVSRLSRGLREHPRSRRLWLLRTRIKKMLEDEKHPTPPVVDVNSASIFEDVARREDCMRTGERLARAVANHNFGKNSEEWLVPDDDTTSTVEAELQRIGFLPIEYPVGRYRFKTGYCKVRGDLICVNDRFGYRLFGPDRVATPLLDYCNVTKHVLVSSSRSDDEATRFAAAFAMLSVYEGLPSDLGVHVARVFLSLKDGDRRIRLMRRLIDVERCHEVECPALVEALALHAAKTTGMERVTALWALWWLDPTKVAPLTEEDKRMIEKWPELLDDTAFYDREAMLSTDR